MRLAGKVDVGDARVALQGVEDLQVDRVELRSRHYQLSEWNPAAQYAARRPELQDERNPMLDEPAYHRAIDSRVSP